MTVYVALLRAVNVGGTGKLAMAELRRLCAATGFRDTRTYIASGNVVFGSDAAESTVKATLERALAGVAGRPVGVFVRTAMEMTAVLAANPFGEAPPNRVAVFFLDAPPPADLAVNGRADERITLGLREIYVHYPNGMGRSRLRIAAARASTARNLATVAALVAMAGASDG